MAVSTTCACFNSGNHSEVTSDFLSCAPCPPPFLNFEEFVTFVGDQNLTDCEIDHIANKCRLEAPLQVIIENTTDISANVTDYILAPVFESGHPLQIWAIVLIVVFSIITIVAALLFGVFIKNRAHGSQDEKSAMKTNDSEYVMQYSSTAQSGTVNVGYSSQESITTETRQNNITLGQQSNLGNSQEDKNEHKNTSVECEHFKNHICQKELKEDVQKSICDKHMKSKFSSLPEVTVL